MSESQEFTLRAALGERENGTWAAPTVADFKPRQAGGKTDSVAARELAGLILFKEKLIIHTAHEFSTANEAFLRLVAIFENYDDLRKKVARIRYANGEQGIELLSGQRLKYRARTGGAGRGFAKADLIVYDEAQHLQAEHVAASGPARLANPNSQSWYAGSGGLATSRQAWALRRRALLGNGGRFAYVENTGEIVTVENGRIHAVPPDPNDREAWARAMPGLNRWVSEEKVEDLMVELGDEMGPRELLCVWDPEPNAGGGFLPMELWRACENPTPEIDVRRVRHAIDVSPDAKSASIASSDGAHVEVQAHDSGTGWVVAKCKAGGANEVTLDPAGPANELIGPLEAAGITVHQVSTRDAAGACAQFLTGVTESKLTHLGQPELDAAVANADRRDVGDGGWMWSRLRSTVDISPLYAATLARWAANGVVLAKPSFVSLDDLLED